MTGCGMGFLGADSLGADSLGVNNGMDFLGGNSGMDSLDESSQDSYVGDTGYGVRGDEQNMGVRHADSSAPDGAQDDGSGQVGCGPLRYDLERDPLHYDLERGRSDCGHPDCDHLGCGQGFPRRYSQKSLGCQRCHPFLR